MRRRFQDVVGVAQQGVNESEFSPGKGEGHDFSPNRVEWKTKWDIGSSHLGALELEAPGIMHAILQVFSQAFRQAQVFSQTFESKLFSLVSSELRCLLGNKQNVIPRSDVVKWMTAYPSMMCSVDQPNSPFIAGIEFGIDAVFLAVCQYQTETVPILSASRHSLLQRDMLAGHQSEGGGAAIGPLKEEFQ